jgi:hypothetical protein
MWLLFHKNLEPKLNFQSQDPNENPNEHKSGAEKEVLKSRQQDQLALQTAFRHHPVCTVSDCSCFQ